jgi:hypothetical protein
MDPSREPADPSEVEIAPSFFDRLVRSFVSSSIGNLGKARDPSMNIAAGRSGSSGAKLSTERVVKLSLRFAPGSEFSRFFALIFVQIL